MVIMLLNVHIFERKVTTLSTEITAAERKWERGHLTHETREGCVGKVMSAWLISKQMHNKVVVSDKSIQQYIISMPIVPRIQACQLSEVTRARNLSTLIAELSLTL